MIACDELTRDQLLAQRLRAACNDCEAATELLSDLYAQSPVAAEDQEACMRNIESSLQSIRYNCNRIARYKA